MVINLAERVGSQALMRPRIVILRPYMIIKLHVKITILGLEPEYQHEEFIAFDGIGYAAHGYGTGIC